LEGYKKVCEFKENGDLDNVHCILPNIELRILPVTDANTPINLHLIIDPHLVDRIDSLLFNNLEHHYIGTTYKCTRPELISLGRAYNSDLVTDEGAYKEGINQFKVTVGQLKEALDKNNDLKNGTIIVVANSSVDGNSGIQHSSLATTRQEIYHLSHAIFSANPEDRKYFLGKKESDDEHNIIEKYGHLMPCIHGSDAHKLDDICKPDQDRYTWIKANPTFEGLKQIIYEPEGRVQIQQEKPENKIPYTVIDSVRFLDSRSEKEFDDKWIELNPNLNSIIGGKSSGKSLLLYHIAKTIDAERIDSINKEKGTHKKIEYFFENEEEFDFEVKWLDGEKYKLRDEDKPNRPITYIPQLYLNRLAEEQKYELNNLVDKMLVDSSNEYNEFRDNNRRELDNIKTEMFQVIDSYYRVKEWLIEKDKELREFGDKQAILENQAIITQKIEKLRKESSFTEPEEKEYTDLTENIKKLNDQLSEKNSLIEVLEAAKANYELFKSNIQSIINDAVLSDIYTQFPFISPEIDKKVSDIISKTIPEIQKTIEEEIEDKFSGIDEEKKSLADINENIGKTSKKLEPLSEKVKNKSVFSQLQKEQEAESAKLKAIYDKQTAIDKFKDKLSTDVIKDKYKKLFKCYQNIVEENRKYESIPDTDDLKLSSIIKINKDKFDNNFVGKINKKKALDQQFGDFFNGENDYLFCPENHLENINIMIDKITLGSISLNTGHDEKHAMLSLLDDYFFIDYNLLQGGDDLIKMSPGKRGIILFQLFLHLSKSTNPILIDQPEDNLDNRTVYQELNDFIRTKKSTRQIIIVSHNPNLVVSTDSENIIVANQDGQNKSGKNNEYQFEYVNGAIEHSFTDENKSGILFQKGIRQHVCDVLEGGEEAFKKREKKYGLKTRK
jgi:predicted ATPase